MTDNETNLTLLNVNQIVSLLSRAYIKLIKNGTPLKSFPSVMLCGGLRVSANPRVFVR